jgi:hypothetical protein
MRKGLWLLVIGILVLLAGTAPVGAGGPPWSAWLYDAQNGRLALVGSDGTVINKLDLPMPQGFNLRPLQVAIARGGTLIAFVATNSDTRESQLRVYDTASQSIRFEYNLPALLSDTISLKADEFSFSDQDKLLAFGYAEQDARRWAILILDTSTGAVKYTLRDDHPALKDHSQSLVALAPLVQRFEGRDTLRFGLVAIGPEGISNHPGFQWSFTSNSVTPDAVYTTQDYDTFEPTNEVIRPGYHPDLPNIADQLRYGQSNVVQVIDQAAGKVFPAFTSPDKSFFWPRFVQNGERVLVGLAAPGGKIRFDLLEREGTLVDQSESDALSGVQGLSDGFIYSQRAQPDQPSRLFYVNTREPKPFANQKAIWASEAGQNFVLVWAQDRRIAPVGPFKPWAQLTPPVSLEQK